MNRLKLHVIFASVLMSATSALAQATVTTAHAAPNYSGIDFATCLSTGCFFPHLIVTARPSSDATFAFYVVVNYRDLTGHEQTWTQLVIAKNPAGDYVSSYVMPEQVQWYSVTARELVAVQEVVVNGN